MQIPVDYHHRLCSRAPGGAESLGIVPGGVSPYERVGPPPVGHRVFDVHASCRWADL